jgi:hypothetical protein
LIGVVMAIVIGGLLGFAIHDVTRYERLGGDGSYDCTNTIIHDFMHPAPADPVLARDFFDAAPPCNRQARVHVFGWVAVFVAVVVSWVLSVTLIRRIPAGPPADDDGGV